jgi:hypothetical protein
MSGPDDRGRAGRAAPRGSAVSARSTSPNPPPVKVRLRLFWQAAKAARGKADNAELRRQFMDRARSSGLVAAVHALSRHGQEDVQHVLDWGLKGWDPWGSAEFPDG